VSPPNCTIFVMGKGSSYTAACDLEVAGDLVTLYNKFSFVNISLFIN